MFPPQIHKPLLVFAIAIFTAIVGIHVYESTDSERAAYMDQTSTYPYRNYYDSGTQVTWGSLSPSPAYGAPGEPVILTGATFPRNTSVQIYFGSAYAGSATTDSEGRFATVINVPNLPEGLITITATNADPYNPPRFYVNPTSNAQNEVTTNSQSLTTQRQSYPTEYIPVTNSSETEISNLEAQLAEARSQLNACLIK